MLYPIMIMGMHSDRLNSLSIKCEQSKKDLASLDLIGERESIETRVNLFMNC
jgi:hypothetical protein